MTSWFLLTPAQTTYLDSHSIHFLDLTILKDNTLQNIIYRKPLSGNTLLQADSNHPTHLIRNIPIGQFLRVRRNCSFTQDFMSKASKLAQHLKQQRYVKRNIHNAWEKAFLSVFPSSLSNKKIKSKPIAIRQQWGE